MATAEQIRANRNNAKKSTGPKSANGKARSRLNGLTHGMRSEEVVLVSESKEDYDKHLAAWTADWNPPTMARAHLVEKLAFNAWKSKRLARMEKSRIERRYDEALKEFTEVEEARVRSIFAKIRTNPVGVVAELETTKTGLRRMIREWRELQMALADPADWNDYDMHHAMYCNLLGEDLYAGERGDLSAGLFNHNNYDPDNPNERARLDAAEYETTVATMKETVLDEIGRLWDLLDELPEVTPEQRRYAESESLGFDVSDNAFRRYEGQLNRSFLADLKQLTSLTASNADLVDDADDVDDPPSDPVEPAAPSEPNLPEPVVVVEPASAPAVEAPPEIAAPAAKVEARPVGESTPRTRALAIEAVARLMATNKAPILPVEPPETPLRDR
jgi:hypothetical protein